MAAPDSSKQIAAHAAVLAEPSDRNSRSKYIVNLSKKNLTDLSDSSVRKCHNYLGVSLAYNRIDFSSRLCSQLTFVKYLNLSHNALTCLPQNFGGLVNLAVFEAANNQISKLPISISNCRSLRFIDLRQNPLVTTWSALRSEESLTFDPVEFAHYIVPFMQAVQKWRQNLIYVRAETMLEFLVICPTWAPSTSDRYYDLKPRDYSSCPLSTMYETRPSKLHLLLNSLQNTDRKSQSFLNMAFLFIVFFTRRNSVHAVTFNSRMLLDALTLLQAKLAFGKRIRSALWYCLIPIFLAVGFANTTTWGPINSILTSWQIPSLPIIGHPLVNYEAEQYF